MWGEVLCVGVKFSHIYISHIYISHIFIMVLILERICSPVHSYPLCADINNIHALDVSFLYKIPLGVIYDVSVAESDPVCKLQDS